MCGSSVMFCETLYGLFVCAFRVCGLFYVFLCSLCNLLCDAVWCVCLCGFVCYKVCLRFIVFACVCGFWRDVVCCVGAFVVSV